MLIPKGGDVFTASTYMNFVYDPKIAAQIAAYVNYVTPVKGAKEEAGEDRPEARREPAHLPDDDDALEGRRSSTQGALRTRTTSRSGRR